MEDFRRKKQGRGRSKGDKDDDPYTFLTKLDFHRQIEYYQECFLHVLEGRSEMSVLSQSDTVYRVLFVFLAACCLVFGIFYLMSNLYRIHARVGFLVRIADAVNEKHEGLVGHEPLSAKLVHFGGMLLDITLKYLDTFLETYFGMNNVHLEEYVEVLKHTSQVFTLVLKLYHKIVHEIIINHIGGIVLALFDELLGYWYLFGSVLHVVLYYAIGMLIMTLFQTVLNFATFFVYSLPGLLVHTVPTLVMEALAFIGLCTLSTQAGLPDDTGVGDSLFSGIDLGEGAGVLSGSADAVLASPSSIHASSIQDPIHEHSDAQAFINVMMESMEFSGVTSATSATSSSATSSTSGTTSAGYYYNPISSGGVGGGVTHHPIYTFETKYPVSDPEKFHRDYHTANLKTPSDWYPHAIEIVLIRILCKTKIGKKIFGLIPMVCYSFVLLKFCRPLFMCIARYLTRMERHLDRDMYFKSLAVKVTAFSTGSIVALPLFTIWVNGDYSAAVSAMLQVQIINNGILPLITRVVIPRIKLTFRLVFSGIGGRRDGNSVESTYDTNQKEISLHDRLENVKDGIHDIMGIVKHDAGLPDGYNDSCEDILKGALSLDTVNGEMPLRLPMSPSESSAVGYSPSPTGEAGGMIALPREEEDGSSGSSPSEGGARINLADLDDKDKKLSSRIMENFFLTERGSLYCDYEEMTTCFTILCLFSPICPILPVGIFIHLYLKLRRDSWGMRKLNRRVYTEAGRQTRNGMRISFQVVCEMIAVISVTLNLWQLGIRLGTIPDSNNETHMGANTKGAGMILSGVTNVDDDGFGGFYLQQFFTQNRIFMIANVLVGFMLYLGWFLPEVPQHTTLERCMEVYVKNLLGAT